jgi:hypothetical protein
MFSLLFSATPQAGGLKDISRWLRETWRATPPDMIADKNRIPEGCQRRATWVPGIPSGCGDFYVEFRWCRSPSLVVAIACGDAISALSRSVNHRLISGKPPACSDDTAQNGEEY